MTKEWGNACWDLFHATAVNLNEKETHLITLYFRYDK